jgi:hypothetical protein
MRGSQGTGLIAFALLPCDSTLSFRTKKGPSKSTATAGIGPLAFLQSFQTTYGLLRRSGYGPVVSMVFAFRKAFFSRRDQ